MLRMTRPFRAENMRRRPLLGTIEMKVRTLVNGIHYALECHKVWDEVIVLRVKVMPTVVEAAFSTYLASFDMYPSVPSRLS